MKSYVLIISFLIVFLQAILVVELSLAVIDESCSITEYSKPSTNFLANLAKGSISFVDANADTFHIVVIGDSIAWGAGLEERNKYYYLLADWLQKNLRRPVDATVYAHTGATIKPSGGMCRYADCGSNYPSLLEQADHIDNRDQVDLILVSGGINDIGVYTIIDSDNLGEMINQRTSKKIVEPMKKLLKKLLNECPNAKIIVTGYYPIFTEHTDSVYYNELYPRVHDFLFEKPPSEGYRIALIENSRVFHDISDRSLRTAVEQVTSEQDALGRNRAVFVPVNFPTEKCLGVMTWHRIKSWNYWRPSYNSLLWNFDIDWLIKIDNELKNNKPIDYAQIKTDDQIYQYRVDNCYEELDKINAIAHPNIMGANRYFDAIKEHIEEKGLTWLDPNYKDLITSIANDLENVLRSSITQQTGAVVDTFSPSPPEEWNKTFGGDGYDEAHYVQITPDGGFVIVGETRSSGIGGEGDDDAWLFKTDSEGNEIWRKTFGGANDDAAYSVQITPDNGFIIVGETRSFGTGNNDVWIIKTDSEGNEIWSKTFGGANDDLARSVQTTPDGGFIIAGETRSFSELGRDAGPLWSYPLHPRDSRLTIDSDIWLIKIDAYGNELWNRTFGQARARDDWTQTGADDGAYSVQITPDGGYILAGFTEGTYNWLIKTDDNGNEIWSKVSDGYGWAFSVQTTRDNNYISSGWDWLTKTDAQGNEIWRKTFGEENVASSVQITTDGGFVIAGSKDGKAMLIKTNAQGSELWIKTFGNGWANSVQNTFDGGYVLAGLSGDCDAWLVKVKSI